MEVASSLCAVISSSSPFRVSISETNEPLYVLRRLRLASFRILGFCLAFSFALLAFCLFSSHSPPPSPSPLFPRSILKPSLTLPPTATYLNVPRYAGLTSSAPSSPTMSTSGLSLSVNYLPSKFSDNILTPRSRRRGSGVGVGARACYFICTLCWGYPRRKRKDTMLTMNPMQRIGPWIRYRNREEVLRRLGVGRVGLGVRG